MTAASRAVSGPKGFQRGVRTVHCVTALLAASLMLAPMDVTGQLPVEVGGEVLPTFEAYSFGDPEAAQLESLSLLTIPLSVTTRLGRSVSARLTGRYARATATRPDGTTSTVAGPTDTELRVTAPLAGEAVTVTGLVSLPTGSPTHTPGEAEVAGAVAADLLPFRVTNWGTGGGVGGSVSFAQPVGSFGVGVSAGYLAAGDFQARDREDMRYEPGDVLRLNGVVDRSFGDVKGSLRVSFQHFSEDALGGTNLFRAGDRIEVLAQTAFPLGGRSSALVYTGVLHREQGAFLTDPRTASAEDLVLLGGGVTIPWSDGTVTPVARLRLFRKTDGAGDGFTTEVGASGHWSTGGMTWGPVASVRFGSVDAREGVSSSFVGGEVGLSFRLGR